MSGPSPIEQAKADALDELDRATANVKRAALAHATLELADRIDYLQAALEQAGADLAAAGKREAVARELAGQAQESTELRRLELEQARRELRALRSLDELADAKAKP